MFSLPAGAAIFNVTSTQDAGMGSLREALINANASPGSDTIQFAIAGSGPHHIQILSDLPVISESLIIDGYSQPGSSVNTSNQGITASIQIILDGNAVTGSTGLWIEASNSIVQGLSIVNCGRAGIVLSSPIAGSLTSGIQIRGNFIGVLPDGTTAAGNDEGIATIRGSFNNQIGGSTLADKNLISGNDNRGLIIDTSNNLIIGNLIGTDASGTSSLGNNSGIIFLASGMIDGSNNLVGSNLAEERNIISGNRFLGIGISASLAALPFQNTQIINNYIGLDVTGTQALGNGSSGISLLDDLDTQIRDNLIGANQTGIFMSGLTRGAVIENNDIGPSASTGNQVNGIHIDSGPSNIQIGNLIRQVGNRIRFNGGNGIQVNRSDSASNALLYNTISDNGGLGIDLTMNDAGPTANDFNDADSGGNHLFNYPVIESTSLNGGQISVSGSYQGEANVSLIIAIYANTVCDISGFGEGEQLLGFAMTSTDASGAANWNSNLSAPAAQFTTLTTLAMDAVNYHTSGKA